MTSAVMKEKTTANKFSALTPFLEDLEARLDPETEERIYREWKNFLDGKFTGKVFSPRRHKAAPSKLSWPEIRINGALEDFDKMALRELKGASHMLGETRSEKQDNYADSGGFPCVRSNYGTPILPTLFGAKLYLMEDSFNTLPGSHALDGGLEGLRALIDRGVPNLRAGLGGKVFEMGERFVEMMQPYPKVKKYVYLYHPDLQGPFDVLEMLRGSELFYDLYDEPELIHQALTVITETYIAFMNEWEKLEPRGNGYQVHWRALHKGRIMLRDDSAMNLSPEMFDEFVRPYDQQLLKEFGGGAIHFCGRGDHYIASMCAMEGIAAINMSQPHYNDMETIYRNTIDKGIPLVGFNPEETRRVIESGRPTHGMIHCSDFTE
jgi:hypothetical protein